MKSATRLDPDLDARLVWACLDGDTTAWKQLVERHERLVYAVARSYGLADSDLEDVFQDVFMALVRGLPRLRDGRALVRWLSSTTDRIARAAALRVRKERVLRVGTREHHGGEPWDFPADLPPLGTDLEVLEQQATVRLALDAIPERCRRLLHALYYEDPRPTYEELASRFHIPVGSLGPTRARCLDRLRKVVRERHA